MSLLNIVTFLNTHFAILALVGPWLSLKNMVNNKTLTYSLWDWLSNTNSGDPKYAHIKGVISIVVFAFFLSVVAYFAGMLWQHFENEKQKMRAKKVLLASLVIEAVLFIMALGYWLDHAQNNMKGSVDGVSMLQEYHVGYSFSIISLVWSAFIFMIAKFKPSLFDKDDMSSAKVTPSGYFGSGISA